MSLLVVGLSHLSAPVATLERAVVSGDTQAKLLHDVHTSPGVMGALVLSTCNRVEVYAEVDSFHGGVAAICELLARHTGLQVGELTGSAYVHYQDRAAQHLLAVTCGLESMVVGESQILGQVRRAVRFARQHGTLGRELSDLSRLALRAGKRAHAETGIDAAGQNLVTFGLDRAAAIRGADPPTDADKGGQPPGLAGRRVLVVGAGAMSSLAVATSVRLGAATVDVANRTRANAERLAEKYGARVIALSDLGSGISTADIVVTCTGALGHVVTAPTVARAAEDRRAAATKAAAGSSGHGDLVFLDLALPRDVDPAVAAIPGVRLIDLAAIAAPTEPGKPGHARAAALASDADIVAVRRIVAQELGSFRQADQAASVAPTVVALRAKAATVVDAELARLERRLGDLDPRMRQEIAKSMGRIADKLLHGPTVRVKELAGSPGAESYETALAVLFELDPDTVQSVGRPDDDMLALPTQEE